MNSFEEHEQFIQTAEERAVRIARLLELIALEKATVERNASPPSIVGQYRELYHERVTELTGLMQDYYGLTVQLPAENSKAA